MSTIRNFIEGTVPGASRVEVARLVEHLESLGIQDKADCARLQKKDVAAYLKPEHCDKFLLKCSQVIRKTDNKKLNILLLGETGVGKSTFINGFANYLLFSSLEEAERNDGVSLIPVSFHMTDKNKQEKLISTGSSENEMQQMGQSCTQMPKTYVFSNENVTVKLIDTPGVGDTRGLDQDRENMQYILSYIGEFYSHLHGICILLKPNQSRITASFKFVVLELLRNLHKSSINNIVFCFTNTKGTFYRPAETLTALRRLLEDEKIPIALNRETMYCFDNEAIRYLLAVQAGVLFNDNERKEYSESFDRSTNEIGKLLLKLKTVPPHEVKKMTSLNSARTAIIHLTRALTVMSANTQINIALRSEMYHELESSKASNKETKRSLQVRRVIVKRIELDRPRKICLRCNPLRDLSKPECVSVKRAVYGKSFAGPGRSPACKQCGCPWKSHEDMTYDIRNVEEITDNPSPVEDILFTRDIESQISNLQVELKELKEEQKAIVSATATFACFLKANAIAAYNDAMDDYFDLIISNAKLESKPESHIEELKTARQKYREETKILQDGVQSLPSSRDLLSSNEIMNRVNELMEMKHAGPDLREAKRLADDAAKKMKKDVEMIVNPSNRPNIKLSTKPTVLQQLFTGQAK